MSHSSSGLLLYAATVDLLAEDFLSEEAQHTLTKKDKITAFCYVLLGGTCPPTSDRLEATANVCFQLLACLSLVLSPKCTSRQCRIKRS